MQIIIFAMRFEGGTWKRWKHTCDEGEVRTVVDSAQPVVQVRFLFWKLLTNNYLKGARYIFNVARGTPEQPAEGDTVVRGVQVGKKMFGKSEGFEYATVRQSADATVLCEAGGGAQLSPVSRGQAVGLPEAMANTGGSVRP